MPGYAYMVRSLIVLLLIRIGISPGLLPLFPSTKEKISMTVISIKLNTQLQCELLMKFRVVPALLLVVQLARFRFSR